MTEPKETADLEAAILAVEDEDAAADAESLDDGADAAGEGADDGDKAPAAAEPAKEPEWAAEYRRTRNPHLIPDPVLREVALDQARLATEKFEKAARIADRLKQLEAEKREKAPEVPQEDAPPSLGDDIDPEFTKAVDARARWLMRQELKAMGLDELPKKFQTVQQETMEDKSRAYADGIFKELHDVHGLTEDDIAYASQTMAVENPGIAALLQTAKGRKQFAALVRLERPAKASDTIDKAAAGEAATLRPSGGVRGSRPVKDYSKMSRDEIEAEIAEEARRLNIK